MVGVGHQRQGGPLLGQGAGDGGAYPTRSACEQRLPALEQRHAGLLLFAGWRGLGEAERGKASFRLCAREHPRNCGPEWGLLHPMSPHAAQSAFFMGASSSPRPPNKLCTNPPGIAS